MEDARLFAPVLLECKSDNFRRLGVQFAVIARSCFKFPVLVFAVVKAEFQIGDDGGYWGSSEFESVVGEVGLVVPDDREAFIFVEPDESVDRGQWSDSGDEERVGFFESEVQCGLVAFGRVFPDQWLSGVARQVG